MRLIPDDTWAILTIWQETRNITFGTSNPSNLEPKQLVDHVRRDGAYLLLCDRPIGESTLTEVGQVLRVEVGAVVEGGEKEIEVGISRARPPWALECTVFRNVETAQVFGPAS